MNKTVLITGVAGLLGSRLADWIIENKPEYKVIGIDDLSGGFKENINKKVKFYKDDINHTCESIFKKHKPDYVFHFAAYAAEGLSPFIRKFNYKNNLVATAEIINNCIKYDVKRLVFTSSLAVYGKGEPPFSEESPLQPIDPYGIAKLGCELDIHIANEQHGLDYCIIRPHNVYGIKQNIWDKYRNVLGIWMYQHLNDQDLTIFGDGEQKRAFSYIDNCLEPFWHAATYEGASCQVINLGGIKECTINEAADILIDVMGGGKKVYLEGRHEVKYAYPTYEKSQWILDYKEDIDLKEGLTNMWEWAQKQPKRKRYVWDQYELDKGIYSFWKTEKK
jgi:UDP-glucose 4-epimerase